MQPNYQIPFEESRLKTLKGGQNYSHLKFKQIINDPELDCAIGSVFGSWIGDTLGSYCEFQTSIVSESRLDQAMQMIGGGCFKILPGQFTDDSQMSAALLQALANHEFKENIEFNHKNLLLQIGSQYVQWLKSNPFDIGNTCYSAISIIQRGLKEKNNRQAIRLQQIFQQIYLSNKRMESNGSLMRIAPLNLFKSLTKPHHHKNLNQLIQSQIKLTHPNQKLVKLGLDWVDLNTNIIKRHSSKKPLKQIYQEFIHTQLNQNQNIIQEYIHQSIHEQYMNAIPKMGWAKIAFSFSLKKLKLISDMERQRHSLYRNSQELYKTVIRDVMKRGGDTDTNCAIVGSMVGGIVGLKGLPKEYVRGILHLDLADQISQDIQPSWYRPFTYEPRRAFLNILKFIGKINPRYKIL